MDPYRNEFSKYYTFEGNQQEDSLKLESVVDYFETLS
jgi:hypothetical protein